MKTQLNSKKPRRKRPRNSFSDWRIFAKSRPPIIQKTYYPKQTPLISIRHQNYSLSFLNSMTMFVREYGPTHCLDHESWIFDVTGFPQRSMAIVPPLLLQPSST